MRVFSSALFGALMTLATVPATTGDAWAVSAELANQPADVSLAADGARKINLAGRQRMLTQRMAKAACFVALGVETERHREMMRAAHDLFDRTLLGLREGDAEQGLAAESNEKVLEGLTRVRRLWRRYGREIERGSGEASMLEDRLSRIAELNMPILVEMNKTVTLTERAYSNRAIPIHKAVVLNISGRQRMLTQKMTKELCLATKGHAPVEMRLALDGTIALFEASLAALIEGAPDVGIQAPNGVALRNQLAYVLSLWTKVAPLYRAVAEGGSLSDADLRRVVAENDQLLSEMNKAVFLFETE